MNHNTKPTAAIWHAIRLAYINSEGSLATLSKRFGVPRRTIKRRSSREGWRALAQNAGGAAVAVAKEMATGRGRQLASTADGFTERTRLETLRFLDRISEMRDDLQTIDPIKLRALVSAFVDTVGVGRTAHGLDREEAAPRSLVQVHVSSPSSVWSGVVIHGEDSESNRDTAEPAPLVIPGDDSEDTETLR